MPFDGHYTEQAWRLNQPASASITGVFFVLQEVLCWFIHRCFLFNG